MTFSELRLSSPILRALAQEGYETPTPIQSQAIPFVLEGRDVLGCAQTGTGKTAAFALPILHRLGEAPADKSRRGPAKARVLVLSPTRELALQIALSFRTYGRETAISGTVIFGGVSQMHQVRDLRRGVDVIVATPGRLIDLMEQGYVDLSGIETLVLDEADRMLDMGFIQPIRLIASKTPATRQTLLFSATMSREITGLAESLLRNPARVAVSTAPSEAPKIEQSLYLVQRNDKQALLSHVLNDETAQRVVVFTKTKHGADRVGEKLERAGVRAETIHGNKSQNARNRALERFRNGHARVLVATDVAARGLDVDGITHVVNFDLPMEPEAYIHRIGRTARAGAKGTAVSFCSSDERNLLRDIEKLLKNRIPQAKLPDLPRSAPEPRAERYRDLMAEPVRPQRPHTLPETFDGPAHAGGKPARAQAFPRGNGQPRDAYADNAPRRQPASNDGSRPHGNVPRPTRGGKPGFRAARGANRPTGRH